MPTDSYAKKGIEATFTDECAKYVAEKSYSAKFGARNMRRFIQIEIEDRIAEKLIETRGMLDHITVDIENETITVK